MNPEHSGRFAVLEELFKGVINTDNRGLPPRQLTSGATAWLGFGPSLSIQHYLRRAMFMGLANVVNKEPGFGQSSTAGCSTHRVTAYSRVDIRPCFLDLDVTDAVYTIARVSYADSDLQPIKI